VLIRDKPPASLFFFGNARSIHGFRHPATETSVLLSAKELALWMFLGLGESGVGLGEFPAVLVSWRYLARELRSAGCVHGGPRAGVIRRFGKGLQFGGGSWGVSLESQRSECARVCGAAD